MATNKVLLDQHASYKVNNKPFETSQYLNLNDVLNGYHQISSHPEQEFISKAFGKTLDSLNKSLEYYIHPSRVLNLLNEEKLTIKSKITNHNGSCQLHYYLTIISLYGTLCFTLACLLDRIFKLKVFYLPLNFF